jgi:LmbE family N-acetylglucosaminyl deacetylase
MANPMPQLIRIAPGRSIRQRLYAGLGTGMNESVVRSAVVFAPHQDDETLGCGGTIIAKRDAGVPVHIVFMTDGTTSHRRFVEQDALRRIRAEEAVRAAGILGVDASSVCFLDYPDGQLRQHHDAAVRRISEILAEANPGEVFVPYRSDGTPDHEATWRIVVEALKRLRISVPVCEYPVWFWNQWPWVSLRVDVNRESLRAIGRVARAGGGAKFLNVFRDGLFVGDALDRKRCALAEHRSQMTELVAGVKWPTLADVSDGEWLNCFFQDFEVFHRWHAIAAK